MSLNVDRNRFLNIFDVSLDKDKNWPFLPNDRLFQLEATFAGEYDFFLWHWSIMAFPYIWQMGRTAMQIGKRYWRLLIYEDVIYVYYMLISRIDIPITTYTLPGIQDELNFKFLWIRSTNIAYSSHIYTGLAISIRKINTSRGAIQSKRVAGARLKWNKNLHYRISSTFNISDTLFQRGRSCRSNIDGDGHSHTAQALRLTDIQAQQTQLARCQLQDIIHDRWNGTNTTELENHVKIATLQTHNIIIC